MPFVHTKEKCNLPKNCSKIFSDIFPHLKQVDLVKQKYSHQYKSSEGPFEVYLHRHCF